MSEQDAPIPEIAQACSPRRRCRWICGLIAGFVLGSLAGISLLLVFMPQHEAMVQIQVRAAKTPFIIDIDHPPLDRHDHANFVHTQMALIRSPHVLDRVLENPAVARWDIVRQQGANKREWLAWKLQVKNVRNSEIVSVSIRTNSADTSETIVNAVIEAYFTFIEEFARRQNNELINNLRIEERRQRQLATTLQESIRRKTREAVLQESTATDGGMSIYLIQEGSLGRDIALANARLTAMRAQRKATVERMAEPHKIPLSILLQMQLTQIQPELEILKGQKQVLAEQREELIQIFRDDDPRIMEFDQQIKLIDERVNNLVLHEGQEDILKHFRLQEEMKLFELDQEIRVQEILVAELTNQFHEQRIRVMELTEKVLDTTFESAQLERAHQTLSLIEDQILAVTTEMRAPSQITPLSMATLSTTPSPAKAVMIAGAGFIVFFLLPLLCMLCCHCCCRCRG